MNPDVTGSRFPAPVSELPVEVARLIGRAVNAGEYEFWVLPDARGATLVGGLALGTKLERGQAELAEGKTDACILLSNKPWDTAAGVAIATEAGAQVVDLDGSTHTMRSKAAIGAAPGLIADIISLIRRSQTPDPDSPFGMIRHRARADSLCGCWCPGLGVAVSTG